MVHETRGHEGEKPEYRRFGLAPEAVGTPLREVSATAGSISHCRTLDNTQLLTESLPGAAQSPDRLYERPGAVKRAPYNAFRLAT